MSKDGGVDAAGEMRALAGASTATSAKIDVPSDSVGNNARQMSGRLAAMLMPSAMMGCLAGSVAGLKPFRQMLRDSGSDRTSGEPNAGCALARPPHPQQRRCRSTASQRAFALRH
jgi:hypothetical protein